MKIPAAGAPANPCEGERKSSINPELWHACAGPLVSLPPVGSYVVYFPQGHSEQVAASMQKDVDTQIPNYPTLPSKLICYLHSVTLHADAETDEVYAQMTLQPVNTYEKAALLASDLALKSNKPQTEFFCKTLTASDTSTHGGFSVPRRAAEKIFPVLDFSMQPPAQELVAKDLHDSSWTFRHIYRGQPKRHLLTTGWSLFVSGKRLFAGDSVLFIRDEKSQLLLGIRRANRQPTNISSSVLSSDSMHIGILAAAAHAAANNSPFTVFYNPRASPSEFVIPLAKYNKAIYNNQISLGMRFRMTFETEESGTRRYMGTITGISDLDSVRWKSSPWRNLQVAWDESTAGERRNRVSVWEIEPVAAPFFICPPPFFRSKRPRLPGLPDDDSSDIENLFRTTMPWTGDEFCIKNQAQNGVLPGLSLIQWMNMQQNPMLTNSSTQSDYLRSMTGPVHQNLAATNVSQQLGMQMQMLQQNNLQFSSPKTSQHPQQVEQLSKLPETFNQSSSVNRLQQQMDSINQQQRQNFVNQAFPQNHNQTQQLEPQILAQNIVQQQQSLMIQNQQPQSNVFPIQQSLLQQLPQSNIGLDQQQIRTTVPPLSHQVNQHHQLSNDQIKLQLLQKFQQQQQSTLSQPSLQQRQQTQLEEQQRLLAEIQQQSSNPSLLSQQDVVPLQVETNTTDIGYSQPMQAMQHQPLQKLQKQSAVLPELPGSVLAPPPSMNVVSTSSSLVLPNGSQSGITDDIPSCSTSPSANNCPSLSQSLLNRSHRGTLIMDNMSQSATTVFCSGTLEAMTTNSSLTKDLQKPDTLLKPSLPISKNHRQGVGPQQYLNSSQIECLDRSPSVTSVCISQTEVPLQQNIQLSAFNPHSMFRDTAQDVEVPIDPRGNVLFGVNIEERLGIPLDTDPHVSKSIGSGRDFENHLSPEKMLANYGNSKEVLHELSSSVVSQPLGAPEMAFSQGVSTNSNINDGSFLNGGGSWAPPSQLQRMRTFTKVYKRGAVGRSVDITRYLGYDELKQDLARMFGIEGQLEDQQRIGWKLVYTDHEGDVLLVGDDPWEEFVNCVRCIKILSPQEVIQMSMEGDFENAVLPNQACSSSDRGNAWRGQSAEQNSGGNPSAISYD